MIYTKYAEREGREIERKRENKRDIKSVLQKFPSVLDGSKQVQETMVGCHLILMGGFAQPEAKKTLAKKSVM